MKKGLQGPVKAFRGKSWRLTLLALFIFTGVFSQVDSNRVRQNINAYGYNYKNLYVDSSHGIPRDTFTLRQSDTGSVAIINNVLYGWTQKSGILKWEAVASTGGIDSLHIYTASDPDPDTLYSYADGDSTLVGFIPKGGAVAWGEITGTLADQTDLQAALDTKLETVATDATLTGDGTSGDPLSVVSDSIIFAPLGSAGDTLYEISGDTVKIRRLNAGANITITKEVDGHLTIAGSAGGSVSIGDAIGSGTSGSVLYVDGSGNLAQNNAAFNYDGSNILTTHTIYPQTTGTYYLGQATQRWAGISVNGINLNQGGTPTANQISVLSAFKLNSSSSPSTSGADIFTFQSAASTATTGTTNLLTMTGPFNPTSGTGTYTYINLTPSINQTGGANGITRGLYINPTLTAAADFRALEVSNNSHWGIYQSGASAKNYFAGENLIGSTTDFGSHTLQNTGGTYLNGSLLKLGASGKSVFENGLYDAAHGSIALFEGSINDPLTAGSGSRSRSSSIEFESNLLTATNASVTHDTSSTVCIEGAPIASTNMTITNPYSLFVAKGRSYLGGGLQMKDLPAGAVGDQVLVQKSDLTTGVLPAINFVQQLYGKSIAVNGSAVTLITFQTATDSAYDIEVTYRGSEQSANSITSVVRHILVSNNSGTVTIHEQSAETAREGSSPISSYTLNEVVSGTTVLFQVTGNGLGVTQRWTATAIPNSFQFK